MLKITYLGQAELLMETPSCTVHYKFMEGEVFNLPYKQIKPGK